MDRGKLPVYAVQAQKPVAGQLKVTKSDIDQLEANLDPLDPM